MNAQMGFDWGGLLKVGIAAAQQIQKTVNAGGVPQQQPRINAGSIVYAQPLTEQYPWLVPAGFIAAAAIGYKLLK